jgi:hypothetical protein
VRCPPKAREGNLYGSRVARTSSIYITPNAQSGRHPHRPLISLRIREVLSLPRRSLSGHEFPRITRGSRHRGLAWESVTGGASKADSSPSNADVSAGGAAAEAARNGVTLRNFCSFPAMFPANAAIVPERYTPDSNTPQWNLACAAWFVFLGRVPGRQRGRENSRRRSPSKHRVNGSNRREFALMLSECQGKM